jgi:hypothetical protein
MMGDTAIASSLLKAVEVWTPSADGALAVDSAMYAGAESFGMATQSLTLEPGTGLPGWVSDARVPVLFDDLSSADFVRSEAAAASNLGAGFGLPVFDGEELTAVMIFLFDSGELARGAFESWLPNATRHELELGTGFYSGLDRFKRLSQYLRFPYGAGLPGEVWQTLTPQLINRLGESDHFLRASGAVADGLDSGLAVPVVSGSDQLNAVFVMLSSNASPIARALAVWVPSDIDGVFELSDVVAPGLPELASHNGQLISRPGEGLISRVVETRKPIVMTETASDDAVFGDSLATGTFAWALAWPVIVHGQVTAICVIAN